MAFHYGCITLFERLKPGWWKEYKKNRLSWPNIWTWLLLQLFGGGVYGESYLIQKPEEWLANLVS